MRLFRKQQLAGSLCALAPPDHSPFTFFANRCVRKGNGSIPVLDLDVDEALPLRLWARWRLSAHAHPDISRFRLCYQEPRTVYPGGHSARYYPGADGWHCLSAGETLHYRCGGYMHLWCSIPPLLEPAQALPAAPTDGWPVYRSALGDLPVEEIVERHYDAKGGRSRSVLTFDRKKKPW